MVYIFPPAKLSRKTENPRRNTALNCVFSRSFTNSKLPSKKPRSPRLACVLLRFTSVYSGEAVTAENPLRISSSSLRFVLVAYGQVRSLRRIRTLLKLLASCTVLLRSGSSGAENPNKGQGTKFLARFGREAQDPLSSAPVGVINQS